MVSKGLVVSGTADCKRNEIMDFENIIFEKKDGIARMIINRPEKRNALNRTVRLEMVNVLGDVKGDPTVQILVISGAGGRSFIAGSDLKELSTFSPPWRWNNSWPLWHSSFTRDLSNWKSR